jgi:hypothetical protein
MESLFSQVAPVLEQSGQLPPGVTADGTVVIPDQPLPANGMSAPASVPASQTPSQSRDQAIKTEDDLEEPFSQLALDEHGHMRWIGGSSTMSLINSFRHLTADPITRVSPMEGDAQSPALGANKLYFPAAVFFGKVRALPGPEEVEYPDRDLADMMVRTVSLLINVWPTHGDLR